MSEEIEKEHSCSLSHTTDEIMFVCMNICVHGHERHQVICYLCVVYIYSSIYKSAP
jgi:hypothetical protein